MNTKLYCIARQLAVALWLVALSAVHAQTSVQAWVKRYSHTADSRDYAEKVVTDNAGNAIVAGSTDDGISGGDFLIIKYSGAGVPLWTNRYDGPANRDDQAQALAVDSSGNVFVTGYSEGVASSYDYATVAYSGAGAPLWTNRYNGPANGDDYAHALAVDSSGNVFVKGWSGGAYAMIKYSGAGAPLWTNRYNGPANGDDSAQALAVDGSGNVIVTGWLNGIGGALDYWTIKYSSAGVMLWANRYDGPGNRSDYAKAVAVDASGNVFVTGYSDSYDPIGFPDYATIKYSSAGVPLWTNRYAGPKGYDYASALAVDGSGNVVVTGWSGGDYATIKYSSAGTALWTNRCNGASSFGSGSFIAVDGSGDVVVTGWSGGDYATIKYSGAGVPLWTNRYNGPANRDDQARAVAVDGSGNVFVTGHSWSGSSDDYATVAYSSAGLQLWTNRYNDNRPGNSDDAAAAVAVNGSGNVFVAGTSDGGGTSLDYATVAYSSAGMPLWTNRYNGPGNEDDQANDMAVDGSGNVFVTGHSWSGSSYDYATVAYSGAGLPLWTNRYNGPLNNDDQATAVAVDGSGNVFVTGSSGTVSYSGTGVPLWTNYPGGVAIAVDGSGNVFVTGSSYDGVINGYATIKYSGAGVPLWTNRYSEPGYADAANAIAVGNSGNVFVTGYSSTGGRSAVSDYATVAYSSGGVPLWTNRYHGSGDYDYAQAVAVDGSDNVFVTGSSSAGVETGVTDYATVAYSSGGVPLWTNRYNGSGYRYSYDTATAVAVDGSGNVFVTGYSYGGGSDCDYATIKYSGAGVPLWTNRYKGPANGDDRPQTRSCLAIGPDGSVYVTGASDGNYTGGNTSDFATVKYITVPVLAIERSADDVILSWPSTFSNFVLQECMDLVTINWTNAPSGINNPVTVPATEPARFYRLRQQ